MFFINHNSVETNCALSSDFRLFARYSFILILVFGPILKNGLISSKFNLDFFGVHYSKISQTFDMINSIQFISAECVSVDTQNERNYR